MATPVEISGAAAESGPVGLPSVPLDSALLQAISMGNTKDIQRLLDLLEETHQSFQPPPPEWQEEARLLMQTLQGKSDMDSDLLAKLSAHGGHLIKQAAVWQQFKDRYAPEEPPEIRAPTPPPDVSEVTPAEKAVAIYTLWNDQATYGKDTASALHAMLADYTDHILDVSVAEDALKELAIIRETSALIRARPSVGGDDVLAAFARRGEYLIDALRAAQDDRASQRREKETAEVYTRLGISGLHPNEPVAWTSPPSDAEIDAVLHAWDSGPPYPESMPTDMLAAAPLLTFMTHGDDVPPSLPKDIEAYIYKFMRRVYASFLLVYFRATSTPDTRRLLLQADLCSLILYEEYRSTKRPRPLSHMWQSALVTMWQEWFYAAENDALARPALEAIGHAIGEHILVHLGGKPQGVVFHKMAAVGLAALKLRYGTDSPTSGTYCVECMTPRPWFDVLWLEHLSSWPQHFGTLSEGTFDPAYKLMVHAAQGLALQVAAVAALDVQGLPTPLQDLRAKIYTQAEKAASAFSYQTIVEVFRDTVTDFSDIHTVSDTLVMLMPRPGLRIA